MARQLLVHVFLSFLFLVLVKFSLASPYPHVHRDRDRRIESHKLRTDAQIELHELPTYAITGAVTGGVQPRLEIRTLAKDPISWNLYLHALIHFQSLAQTDELSYYLIAGIHGQPYTAWDQSAGAGNHGYCPHGSNLFGPWHRMYNVLFEQILSSYANTVAKQWCGTPLEDNYRDAAARLRAPFWDWAIVPPEGEPIFPVFMTLNTTQIIYANGSRHAVANPLYSYRFHPLDPSQITHEEEDGPPFNIWSETIRNPSNFTMEASSSNEGVESYLSQAFNYYQSQVYLFLTTFQTYNQYSTLSANSTVGSMESLHDLIHGAFGKGHLGYFPTSAIDPAFWLHHVNVDRLNTLWQTLYPDTWVEALAQEEDTFTAEAGSIADQDTPLTPFHQDTHGTYWTSRGARQYTKLGYDYPELVQKPDNATLRATINKLYSGNGNHARNSGTELSMKRSPGHSESSSLAESEPSLERAYFARLNFPWTHPSGGYSVSVFMDGGSNLTSRDHLDGQSPSDWHKSPYFVGAQRTLHPGATRDRPVMINILAPLAHTLQRKVTAQVLLDLDDHDQVLAYTKLGLRIRVEQNGVEIDRSTIPGLRVELLSVNVRPAANDTEFPRWMGEPEIHLILE